MKRFAFLAGAVIFVVLAWTGGWFFVAAQMRGQLDALAASDGEASPQLTCGRPAVSGFPFFINLACDGVTLVSGDLTARLDALHASTPVMWPLRTLLSGRGAISIEDAFTGSRSRIEFSSLTATARLEGSRIGRLSLVADDVRWLDTNFGDTLQAAAKRLEAHAVDNAPGHQPAAGTATLELFARIDAGDVPGLAVTAGSARFDAELTGVPDDVRRLAEVQPARDWQTAGGQLILRSLDIDAGPRTIDARGNFALDSAGRLEGQLDLTSTGVAETLGPLLPAEIRSIVLGSPSQDGSYNQTLNARAGIVFAGFLPVSVIPPLF